MVAVRLKPRITILLKRKRTARSRAASFRQFNFMAQPRSRPRGARLAKPTEERPSILHNQTERLLSVCHFTIGIIYELPSWPISRSNGCISSMGRAQESQGAIAKHIAPVILD
jgi:hypothetical protein